MNDEAVHEGRCVCGAVRYKLRGEPLRVGVCHCQDCRRFGGSAFSAFAIWPRDAYEGSGELKVYDGRSFCSVCGSRVVSLSEAEAEVMIGTLDAAPSDLKPQYELWVWRREHWLAPLGVKQFEHDREDGWSP